MTLQDYEVIVYISKAMGVRIKSLFIMSEFDRSNICARYPTTNERGSDWNNSTLVDDTDFVMVDYVKENAAHIERRMRICLPRIAQTGEAVIYRGLCNRNVGHAQLCFE